MALPDEEDLFELSEQLGEAEDEGGLTDVAALRERLFQREQESASEAAKQRQVLEQIQQAKLKLLEAPSRKEALMGLAQKLSAPRERTDPRFFERQNLYTFLRDIGEYGGEQRQAEKERQAAIAELKEKYATEALKTAESGQTRAQQLAAQYLSKEPKAAGTGAKSEFERLIANLPEADQIRLRKQYLDKLTTRAPRAEKAEPDPDRPSSVVLSRISGVVNRELSPIKSRLGALNETRAAIADARTNPAQVPQVDRFFARLSGDSQLSQLEVNAVTNAGSFPARISSQLSKFFTGVPTDLSLDEKARVLDVLEEVLGPSFNQQRNQLISQFSIASDISPEAVERIVGPRYLTAAERRRIAEQKKREEEAKRNESAGAGGETVTLSGGKSGKAVK